MFSGEMKGKKVSVQVFKDNSWTSPLAFCDALVEAAIMTTLNHPNLVQLTGVHVNHKYVWMVTEFMEKGSLAEYLRSKGTLVHKSLQLKFAIEICSGMAYLEQKHLVHKCVVCCVSCVMCCVLCVVCHVLCVVCCVSCVVCCVLCVLCCVLCVVCCVLCVLTMVYTRMY